MTELPLRDILAQGGFALSLVVFILLYVRSQFQHTSDLRRYADAATRAIAERDATIAKLVAVSEDHTKSLQQFGEQLRSTQTQAQLAIMTRAGRGATPQPFQAPTRAAPIPREEPEGRGRR